MTNKLCYDFAIFTIVNLKEMKMKCILLTCFTLMSISILSSQELIYETIDYDGNLREYALYVPVGYDATVETPLVFNFHGGGGDIASQLFVSDMRNLADLDTFLIVYPQALPDPNDEGNTLWTHKPPTQVDDVYFVETLIDEISTQYSINADKVFACGYSNGGEFTFELACRLSDRIAAIGVVARSMYIETLEACNPTHPMMVMTIHGTDDEYEGIEWLGTTYYPSLDVVNAYWSDHNKTSEDPVITQVADVAPNDGSTVERIVWGDGEGCSAVIHLKVNNGGHDWPGTFGNMDINANEEIWNMFKYADRTGGAGCFVTNTTDVNARNTITLYPNPASDLLKITGEFDQRIKYEVYSMHGELLISDIRNTIDISQLSTGTYYLKLNGSFKKFVKL